MDSINIVLYVLIIFILYILVSGKKNIFGFMNDKQESYDNNYQNSDNVYDSNESYESYEDYESHGSHGSHGSYPNSYADNLLNDVVSWDGSFDSLDKKPIKLNPNYLNIQFHNDYRDVISALNNIVPDKKQLFNIANIPLNYSEPEAGEVKNLVVDFIDVLNKHLTKEIPNIRSKNTGWDEPVQDPKIKSGWDKVQESLGLPTSLYEEPKENSLVKLIAIKQVQKYETEDEIKYSIDIVLQKLNVDDQMIIKADFVQDKRPLHNENNFFKSSTIEMKVWIENIFITGYLSQKGDDAIKLFDGEDKKYYDYDRMEYNNIVDPKYVQKILMEKYRQRNREMENRTALLDEEGRKFHENLPHIYDFSNIKGTRTIFDDMNSTKLFY